MPVPISRPTVTKFWGPLGYLKDLIAPPGYVSRGPLGSRPAAAATRTDRAPTDAELRAEGYGFGVREYDPLNRRSAERAPTDAELKAEGYGFGVREYDPLERGTMPPYAGATPAGARGIVQGVTRGGQVDRTQSDLYRQYAMTPQGQFERYFSGGEMDQYFGDASRGKGAPKDLEAMKALAGQAKAPTDTPLATYYRAQSAAGRGSMDEIISAMGYQGPMAEWAKANPMLAQREYAKKFPGGSATQFLGTEGAAPTADYSAGAFDTSALSGTDPINKPFELPGGAMTQGQAVSAPYFQANAMAAQKTNPQNASSQMPIGERAEDFLQNLGVLKTKPGQGAFGS